MKLKDIYIIEGEIELLTGLHIGAGNDEIKIGGIDNPVVRDPLTGKPYIPGSSVKGKMRMLTELYLGKINPDGKPWQSWDDDNGKKICKLFGISGDKAEAGKDQNISPARLNFYDLDLINDEDLREKVGALMTEDKVEVSINRVSGAASKAGPRHTERVPAGARFNFKLALRVFDVDENENLLEMVKKSLKLLQADSLGGSGSRGYGKFKFSELKVKSLFNNNKIETIKLDDVTL